MAEVLREERPEQTQDATWQKQQIKSFTAWVNAQLIKVGLKVENIGDDFSDGIKLMKLIEVISGDTLPRPEKGKMKLHKIQNINKALDHIASKKVKLVGISSEEIYDCNLKMILGMIWILILKFQIQDISVEEMSARDGLLLWAQKKTAGYKGCNVQNFHTSWQDGKAFCALINKHRPDLLDYSQLSDDPRDNLNLAFKVAEEHLDIPQMLDADDMLATSRPDERSVMTYVAMYYHCFAGSQKTEQAAKRLEAVLALERELQQMISDYETRASDLLAWIAQKDGELSESERFASFGDLKTALAAFKAYKSSEKPPKGEEKISLESHYSALQTKLRLNNRPAYHPSEGKLVSDIQTAWDALGGVEKTRNSFLRSEQDRLEKLEKLAKRFKTKSNIHSKWASGKVEACSSEECGSDVGSVMGLIKQHDAFNADVEAHALRVENLKQISSELREGEYENADDIESQLAAIEQDWESLTAQSAARKALLEEALAKQQQLDELRLQFAKEAGAFASWCETATEDLMEDVDAKKLKDVDEHRATFEALKEGVAAKQTDFDSVMALSASNVEAGITSNNYTALTAESLEVSWNEISTLINEKEESLNLFVFDLLKLLTLWEKRSRLPLQNKQEEREAVRVRFAEAANALGEKISSATTSVNEPGSGSLEDQLASLQAQQVDIANLKPEFDDVAAIDAEQQEAEIYDNDNTEYTMSDLAVMYDQLNGVATKATTTIENQILMRDQSGISEEQMEEYKDAFKKFDKNKSGNLDKNELRSALLGIGFDVPEGEENYQKIWEEVDPGQTGACSFEAFVDFLSKDKTDASSISQFIESFKCIAGDKDYITEDEVRRELNAETAEYVISQLAPYDGVEGGLDYKAYAEKTFQ
eukprot:Awhi_evm1s326